MSDVVRRADALFEQMTVVPEARVAAAFGLRDRGVTSMHDATEGGVLGGLLEVAVASDVGMRIELDAIPVRPEVRAVCDHVGIDPYIVHLGRDADRDRPAATARWATCRRSRARGSTRRSSAT